MHVYGIEKIKLAILPLTTVYHLTHAGAAGVLITLAMKIIRDMDFLYLMEDAIVAPQRAARVSCIYVRAHRMVALRNSTPRAFVSKTKVSISRVGACHHI
jgi:hypothetical protein